MGLSARLLRLATLRPRCYVVEAPGGTAVRRAVEAELDRRGWRPAHSPAHADALVVAGDLPDDLSLAGDVLWSQLPGPRAHLDLSAADDVFGGLDTLPARLADGEGQATDARSRELDPTAWVDAQHEGEHGDDGHGEHGGHEGHHDHDGHGEHGEHDDHGGHDHGGHEMAPSGIPLAGGAEDRDGLEMDELVHPLGPLLDRWPGGLELRLRLHGDVVADAEVRWWGAAPESDRSPTAGWDAMGTTLSLLGDERHARLARRLRDRPAEVGEADAQRLHDRVRRLARGGALPGEAARILLSLSGAAADDPPPRSVTPEALVRGHDLGDARLLVAAHAPLLRTAAHDHQEVGDA